MRLIDNLLQNSSVWFLKSVNARAVFWLLMLNRARDTSNGENASALCVCDVCESSCPCYVDVKLHSCCRRHNSFASEVNEFARRRLGMGMAVEFLHEYSWQTWKCDRNYRRQQRICIECQENQFNALKWLYKNSKNFPWKERKGEEEVRSWAKWRKVLKVVQ